MGKGLLKRTNNRPATFKTMLPFSSNPAIFESLVENFDVTEKVTDDVKIDHTIQPQQ